MTTFEGSSRKGLAVGLWAATSGLGIALGPILGGLLLEHFSWESIFWVNVPLALITVPAVLVAVPESRSSEKARFDVVGAILSAIGVGALVWGIIEGPHRGWTSGSVTTAFIEVFSPDAFVEGEDDQGCGGDRGDGSGIEGDVLEGLEVLDQGVGPLGGSPH